MGKYQLVRRLATGGMAEVFLAKAAGPMGFEKELVVKRILPHLAEDPQFVEMFLTEAKLAARLNHGNVVQIFDFGEQEDSYFIAMEYVQGLNLKVLAKRAFQRGTPIPYPLIARIVSQACEGLAYAHELVEPESGKPMGFIHRDISTDNILVSLTGGVKVVDFGIAKAANVGQQTQGGVIKGKMSYMPPEYLKGIPIDSRADIYALGVVLYELIAGRKPFVAETEAQLAQLIVHTPAVDVRTLRTDVPAPLVQVVERALHKDRQSRYASCRQFQADLERFLFQYGEPVSALQIAEWVKELAAMDPALARRSSTEIPAAASGAAPAPATGQATRSLRPPSLNAAPQPPVEDTIVTPPPITLVMENDEELLRLVARPRWHKYLAIAAGALILGGVGVVSFSESTPPPSETATTAPKAQGAAPEQAVPAPVVTPPPVSAQALLVPNAGVPATEQTTPSKQDPKASPVEEPARPDASRPPAGVTSSKMATLTVVSSLVPCRVWIGDRELKNPHGPQVLKPGWYTIEVSGFRDDNKKFHKIERVNLKPDDKETKVFEFLYLSNVKLIDVPPGMEVITLDEQKFDRNIRLSIYEGIHSLRLLQASTGKSYVANCLAKASSNECKFNMKSLMESR